MFIELQEYYYWGSGYLTKPLLLNVDEISTFAYYSFMEVWL